MTTIRVKPEELEAVAEHIPDAEDGCSRARTSLSWEFPSLVMKIPSISTAAIDSLKDELIHWLARYEEKLNEAEELLYRTAAAMRQADQTLADNMLGFGLELLGWYDLQRLFGEYDPITGERISTGDRWLAGGMLLLSVIPPAKGAGVAGKAGIKGVKAAETAADVSKLVSQTKHVLRYDKIMPALQSVYHQVVKAPITQTIRSFKQQWENFLENVGSVLQGPQPALVRIGPAPRMWMSGAEKEVKETTMNIIGKTGDEVVGKGTGKFSKYDVGLYKEIKGVPGLDAHHVGQKAIMKKFIRNYDPNNAPAILVTKAGHTRKGPRGIVLRSSKGIESARRLLARDIMELRRVYPDIPNSQLRKLIELNKQLYPEMRRR
jgi:Pre-toxin TG